MVEDILVTVGKSEENTWRRNNLLSLKHCIDKTSHYEVYFQWVDYTERYPKQIRLTYQIVK